MRIGIYLSLSDVSVGSPEADRVLSRNWIRSEVVAALDRELAEQVHLRIESGVVGPRMQIPSGDCDRQSRGFHGAGEVRRDIKRRRHLAQLHVRPVLGVEAIEESLGSRVTGCNTFRISNRQELERCFSTCAERVERAFGEVEDVAAKTSVEQCAQLQSLADLNLIQE